MGKVSKTEDILYETMLSLGLRPERQYSFKEINKYGYELDFAFPEERVNIEVDGTGGNFEHHLTESRRRKDNTRDDVLQSLGWKVRRFTDKEVREDPYGVAIKISRFIKKDNKDNHSLKDYAFNNKKQKVTMSVKNQYNQKVPDEVAQSVLINKHKQNKPDYSTSFIIRFILLFATFILIDKLNFYYWHISSILLEGLIVVSVAELSRYVLFKGKVSLGKFVVFFIALVICLFIGMIISLIGKIFGILINYYLLAFICSFFTTFVNKMFE